MVVQSREVGQSVPCSFRRGQSKGPSDDACPLYFAIDECPTITISELHSASTWTLRSQLRCRSGARLVIMSQSNEPFYLRY